MVVFRCLMGRPIGGLLNDRFRTLPHDLWWHGLKNWSQILGALFKKWRTKNINFLRDFGQLPTFSDAYISDTKGHVL